MHLLCPLIFCNDSLGHYTLSPAYCRSQNNLADALSPNNLSCSLPSTPECCLSHAQFPRSYWSSYLTTTFSTPDHAVCSYLCCPLHTPHYSLTALLSGTAFCQKAHPSQSGRIYSAGILFTLINRCWNLRPLKPIYPHVQNGSPLHIIATLWCCRQWHASLSLHWWIYHTIVHCLWQRCCPESERLGNWEPLQCFCFQSHWSILPRSRYHQNILLPSTSPLVQSEEVGSASRTQFPIDTQTGGISNNV